MARALKIFMRGQSVRRLQTILRGLGYTIEDQSSVFGTSTREAVKSYQKQHQLKATGRVDDDLMAKMQFGMPDEADTSNSDEAKPENECMNPTHEKQAQAWQDMNKKFDMLIQLLEQKDVLKPGEIQRAMQQNKPTSL